jgi:hypothetical protein
MKNIKNSTQKSVYDSNKKEAVKGQKLAVRGRVTNVFFFRVLKKNIHHGGTLVQNLSARQAFHGSNEQRKPTHQNGL